MSDLPPLPDPAYIYHPAFGEPGTDEYVSDDLHDFAVSGAVDEGCDRCVRLYTKEHMYAYARADLAQPAPEPVVWSRDLKERIFRTIRYYADRTTYEGARIGGVLAGCPRGPAPTSYQLASEARSLLLLLTDDPAHPPAQPAQEPVGIVREVVMHAVGVIVEGNVYATAQHTEMQVMWMDESPPNGTLLYAHPPAQAAQGETSVDDATHPRFVAGYEAGINDERVYAKMAEQVIAVQVDALDAKRYRWLRDGPREQIEVYFATDRNQSGWGAWDSWTDKDAAIDAAMQAEGEK